MCEVLPPIHESSSPSPEGENSKLEQLMINMLEERDKLMEKLRECQESYSEATKKLSLVEADNGILMRQLQALMPDDEERLMNMLDDIRANGGLTNGMSDDVNKWPVARTFAQLARELAAANEKIVEKQEEVGELKSERSNTRLLLEHLECLVARHERSLRMTVIKRQTSNAGVSSEVEVLKALKSLFDHHKALDEKVRERLRSAQERNVMLEDELMLANQEIKTLKDNNKRMKRLIQQRKSIRMSSIGYDNFSFSKEQLAMLEERDQTIGDLQFSLDERTTQLEEAMHMQDELSERVQELEEELAMALAEVNKTKDSSKHLSQALSEQNKLQSSLSQVQFELNESVQELSAANESNQQLTDQVDALKDEIDMLKKDLTGVRAELTQRSHALNQAMALKEDMLQQQNKELTQAEQEIGSAEHQIQSQQDTIRRLHQELTTAQEKERINEKNVSHLQSTVDRMLNEAKERLRTHSAERKTLMDEKMATLKKYEEQKKTLKTTVFRNKQLTDQLEELQNQSLRAGEGGNANGVVFRNKSAHTSTSNKQHVRYSWQVTDIDDAIETVAKEEKSSSLSTEAGVAGDKKLDKLDISEEGEWDVSQLVSMLETQVSKLDKQLESMGDNMAEADEFDRVMQSVADGSYRPSPSAGMETFPHSNPPPLRHKKKFHGSDALPKTTLYRVSLPPSFSPGNSPTSTASNESIPSPPSNKKSSIKHRPSFSKLFHKRKTNAQKKAAIARRASAPLPKTAREADGLDGEQRESVDFSDLLDTSEEREENMKKKAQLLFSVLEEGIPFRKWTAKLLVAWLEVWVGVPFWYIAALRNCLDSGETLAKLSDAELEQELGITNTLHRLKLRLAIQEIVTVTSNAKSHRTTSPYGEMAHEWIGDYWLHSVGLAQYKEVFKACLVDARMLEYLTKRDLRTALKMVDGSHRNSLQYGISVLKKLDYNRQALESRRSGVIVSSRKDVLLWTSDHVIEWVESLGLDCNPQSLHERGVHGGVLALDNDYGYEKLALALQIPLTDIETRRLLRAEFTNLLCEGTKRTALESQSHGRIVRRLSKRLKVGTRIRSHQSSSNHSEFLSVRPPSPVLVSHNPVPLHMQSLLEEEGESSSSLNTSTASNYDTRTQTPTEFST